MVIKRKSGIELFRVVLMIMIIGLPILMQLWVEH
mgnify:CR=1 FL=1